MYIRCILLFSLVIEGNAFSAEKANGSEFIVFAGYEVGGNITLDDIRRQIGKTTLTVKGDAGNYEASICYLTTKGSVYFLSGELGGLEHELLGVELKKAKKDKNCSNWKPNKAEPELKIGRLLLGMTVAEFTKILNTKLTWSKDNTVADALFESELKMTKQEQKQFHVLAGEHPYFDSDVFVHGEFKNGKLIDLSVWKTTTY